MTEEEHADWLEAADYARTIGGGGRGNRPLGSRPCQDCTRDFAAEMRFEDHCDGVPGVWREMDATERREYRCMESRRWRQRQAVA